MGSKLKELRKAKGFSQERLAKITGISRVSIARYETGVAVPNMKNARKLAEALECSIDDIVR